MTLTLQLGVWLVACALGWFAGLVVTYRTYGRLQVFRAFDVDDSLQQGTFRLLVFGALGLATWSIFLGLGLAAAFDTGESGPVGQTLIGVLIGWGLITAVGILAAQTMFGLWVDVQQTRLSKRLIQARRQGSA